MPADAQNDPARDARLGELRERFAATLEKRVAAIVGGVTAVRVGPWCAAPGDALLTDVHALSGSAGLFGADRIGEMAAAVERLLMALQRRASITAVDVAMLREAVQRLQAAYDARRDAST